MDESRLVKQKFNIIMLLDVSKSMFGKRIAEVNKTIYEIQKNISNTFKTDVDIYLSILTFNNEAKWYNDQKEVDMINFKFNGLKASGKSNLHLAYHELNNVLKKQSNGGIMPDFKGVAPVILLITDGHPSRGNLKEELILLKEKPWFNIALKYGIAVESNDKKTINVLREFVSNNGDVMEVYDAKLLNDIVKIMFNVILNEKVMLQTVHDSKYQSFTNQIQFKIQEAIANVERWDY